MHGIILESWYFWLPYTMFLLDLLYKAQFTYSIYDNVTIYKKSLCMYVGFFVCFFKITIGLSYHSHVNNDYFKGFTKHTTTVRSGNVNKTRSDPEHF